MPADLVASIAGESEETRIQREQLTRQLDVLMKGSETCKRFIGVRGLGADDRTIQGSDWFKSAGHDSSDYEEGSEEGFGEGSDEGSEDALRRVYGTELLDKEAAKGIDNSNVSEIPVPVFEEEISYMSSKKKSKKSKLATKRAMFEEALS